MENEIKVNEYIRTKRGSIDKAVKISDNYISLKNTIFITEYGESCTLIKKTDVVKHSPNLIDIIEENDIGIMNCYGLIVKKFLTMDDILGLKTKEYELLELVTKEQFESISYKVERKD